jgi:hypothetical protein
VAVNSHDLQRSSIIPNQSYTGQVDKNLLNNHDDLKKASTATAKLDHTERLTVIG